MSESNIILSQNKSTVVAEYTPEHKKSDAYQSEAALEKRVYPHIQLTVKMYISKFV